MTLNLSFISYCVYVLLSLKDKKFYTGYKENLKLFNRV